MRFAWRRRHHGRGTTELPTDACAHAWRPRDVTAALPGAVCIVCDRCGALRLIEEGQERGTNQGRVPDDPISQNARPAGKDIGTLASPSAQERPARHGLAAS
jgi:hypothetical protein